MEAIRSALVKVAVVAVVAAMAGHRLLVRLRLAEQAALEVSVR